MSLPINVNRFQNKVRALFGIRGDNPVPTLDDLRPVIVVESDRPEWAFGGSELLLWDGATVTPAAGQTGGIRIRNPLGSGNILVLERMVITTAAAALLTISVGETDVDLAVAAQLAARDTRLFGGTTSRIGASRRSVEVNPSALPALVSDITYLNLPGGESFPLPLDGVLGMGTAVQVTMVTTGVELRVSTWARERPQERGETS